MVENGVLRSNSQGCELRYCKRDKRGMSHERLVSTSHVFEVSCKMGGCYLFRSTNVGASSFVVIHVSSTMTSSALGLINTPTMADYDG